MYLERITRRVKEKTADWVIDNVANPAAKDFQMAGNAMFIGATIALEEEARYALLEARGKVKE